MCSQQNSLDYNSLEVIYGKYYTVQFSLLPLVCNNILYHRQNSIKYLRYEYVNLSLFLVVNIYYDC